ncbi:MAG: hypothetical protein ACI4IS_02905 [Acutalibacteraceae bacterium]
MDNQQPLSIIIENAKARLLQSLNQVLKETNLPAFLVEGMVLELLAEVRGRKNLELAIDFNRKTNDENEVK